MAAAVALAAGFLWYASIVPTEEVVHEARADGIVALTGGAERIGDAVELLAADRGRRLLITGVNPATRPDELFRRVTLQHDVLLNCCIDLDRTATNTIGNAIETRRWAREHGFRSLIVVTSNYHMPRALAELSHQMPDVMLIAHPVVTERQRGEPWWESAAATRLLVSEYLKYIVAVVRMRFEPTPHAVALADERAAGAR